MPLDLIMIGKITFNSRPAGFFDYLIDEKDLSAFTPQKDCGEFLTGARVEVPFGRSSRRGYLVELSGTSSLPADKLKKISRFIDTPPGQFDKLHIDLARILAHKYIVSVGEIMDLIYPLNLPAGEKNAPPLIPLMPKKKVAPPMVSILSATLSQRLKKYEEIISETIESGGSALLILPTEEDVRYFKNYFASFSPLVWNSSFSPSEMSEFYRRLSTIDNGKGRLVIGTRRASFLNPRGLQRIIVERDYDYGHKDGHSPYYTTRDIVIEKARISDVEVIFGGLAFSVDVFNLIKNSSSVKIYGSLPEKYYGTFSSPKKESEYTTISVGRTSVEFSDENSVINNLKNFLDSAYARGECAVIGVPRKAGEEIYYCRACRKVVVCPKCDSPLGISSDNLEKNKAAWKCPHCGWTSKINLNPHCLSCGSNKVRKKSFQGVDSIARIISTMYPSSTVAKVSSDESGSRHSASQLTQPAAETLMKADFVITTTPIHPWRISKKIILTLILNAGLELAYPEYTSLENFFLEVAEYLDFSDDNAMVILFPFRRAPSFIKENIWWQNFYNFYDKEIENRSSLGYPPFGNISEITISAKSPETANKNAQKIADDIKEMLSKEDKDSSENFRIELLDSSDIPYGEKNKKDVSSGKCRRKIILKYEKLTEEIRIYLASLPSERVRIEITPSFLLEEK